MRGKGGRGAARISVRVDRDVLKRVARLTGHVGRRTGAPATRNDVLLEALLRGLAILEDASDDAPGRRRPR